MKILVEALQEPLVKYIPFSCKELKGQIDNLLISQQQNL